MTALVVTNSSCLKLSRTAIKADKQKDNLLNWLQVYFTRNRERRLKSKKAQPTAAPEISPPLKNPWHSLREAKEKSGGKRPKSQNCTVLAQLYDQARTYFQQEV